VTLAGKLEYLSASGWQPLAGRVVDETSTKFNGLTTDANGAFHTLLTLDGSAGQSDWTLDFNRWQAGEQLFFDAPAQTTVHAWVTAPTATAIKNFNASLDTHSRLTVSGDLSGPTMTRIATSVRHSRSICFPTRTTLRRGASRPPRIPAPGKVAGVPGSS
jgi:hypothetical protein